jgi:membrane glycosyltransferase
MEYIMPELLIGIPFLVGIGKFIKSATSADNKWIPLILGIIGVIFAPAFILVFHVIEDVPQAIFIGIVQGVLVAAVAVYGHTVFKMCTQPTVNKQWTYQRQDDKAVIFDGNSNVIAESYDFSLLCDLANSHNETV